MSERDDNTRAFPVAGAAAGSGWAGGHSGSGAEGATAVGPATDPATRPDYSPRPARVRRPDVVGGLLLLLAGAAAGLSLILPWVQGRAEDGLDLVRRGIESARAGDLVSTGYWQPLAVVGGGALLLVLGLLVLLPARSHRLLGGLAVLLALAATVAVLVPLAAAGWRPGVFGAGFWCAVAVAVCGLLGGTKALLTRRR